MLKWIASEGGPLVLLSRLALPAWKGIHGESGETDYDRACGVEDELGLIAVGEISGLVLGDEPLQTAWIPKHAGYQGLLVRWSYAESEEAILHHLRDLPPQLFAPTGIRFHSVDRSHQLFDAALGGDQVDSDQGLEIEIPVGTYRIESALFAPDDATAVLLHALRAE